MLPENVRERVVKEQNELRDKITKLACYIQERMPIIMWVTGEASRIKLPRR